MPLLNEVLVESQFGEHDADSDYTHVFFNGYLMDGQGQDRCEQFLTALKSLGYTEWDGSRHPLFGLNDQSRIRAIAPAGVFERKYYVENDGTGDPDEYATNLTTAQALFADLREMISSTPKEQLPYFDFRVGVNGESTFAGDEDCYWSAHLTNHVL